MYPHVRSLKCSVYTQTGVEAENKRHKDGVKILSNKLLLLLLLYCSLCIRSNLLWFGVSALYATTKTFYIYLKLWLWFLKMSFYFWFINITIAFYFFDLNFSVCVFVFLFLCLYLFLRRTKVYAKRGMGTILKCWETDDNDTFSANYLLW